MSPLDLFLVVLLALSAFAGYRRGAILQAFGLAGLALGVGLAALVAPQVSRTAHDSVTAAAIAVGIVLVGAAIGNVFGWLAGSRVKRRVDQTRGARIDRVGGATLSVAALLLATWFLALNLLNGPFPELSRELRASKVVAVLRSTLPRPPALLTGVEQAASYLGFPDAFAGLPPPPAQPVALPPSSALTVAEQRASGSTVEVLADGCSVGFYSEGSGFVAADGYVLTNAHVIAGSSRQTVDLNGDRYDAVTVLYDPRLDVAVLHVPGLTAPALPLATTEQARGTPGVVLGYPDGNWTQTRAAVRTALDAVGHDIYKRGEIHRRLYELQAVVHQGNSGGPFVLTDGTVAGVVFASSTLDDHAAYALTSGQVAPAVAQATGRIRPVRTGACTSG
ncbi:MAG: MarP family serine protease [Actinomycetota bacterium]